MKTCRCLLHFNRIAFVLPKHIIVYVFVYQNVHMLATCWSNRMICLSKICLCLFVLSTLACVCYMFIKSHLLCKTNIVPVLCYQNLHVVDTWWSKRMYFCPPTNVLVCVLMKLACVCYMLITTRFALTKRLCVLVVEQKKVDVFATCWSNRNVLRTKTVFVLKRVQKANKSATIYSLHTERNETAFPLH